MNNGISILICSHNSANRIENTLSHLSKQKVNASIPWEIVLVDNASTDGTAEIATSLWKSDVPLRIIDEPKLGVAYARITGMNACQYSYISFVDDDNWVSDNWIENAYLAMESHPNACAVGGPSEAALDSPAPDWFATYSKNYAVGEQYDKPGEIKSDNLMLWGAGLTLRKEAWDTLYEYGFEPIQESRKGKSLLSGEETEVLLLFKLMGLSMVYEPKLKIKHFMPANRLQWQYYLRLKKALGASSVYLDIYRKIIGYLLRGEKLVPDPWKKGVLQSLIIILKDPLALLAGLFNVKQGNYRTATAYFNLGKLIQKIKLGASYEILQNVLYNKYASLRSAWENRKSS